MAIPRRSKCLYVMFRLLLLLHLASSTWALFQGRVFLRLMCFNHSSSSLQSGAKCDADSSSCDPELIFCFFNSTHRDTCNIGRSVFVFQDSLRLGVCLGPVSKNVPDPLEIDMTTNESELSLTVTINDIDQSNLFERRALIDELSFRLLPAGLPTLPYGQKPRPEDFGKVPIVSRTSRNRGRPSVQLEAVVQCPAGRFGSLCEVECTATNQFGCFNNGSRQCRPGWSGANCTERDFCAGQPCKPWAVCSATPGGFQCTCDGATGPQCLRGGDPCLNHRCVNNGSCLGVSGRPVCVCRLGWKGRFCHETDPCHPNPCVNGRCFSRGATTRCQCAGGFTGPTCNETKAAAKSPEEQRPNAPGKAKKLSTALLLLLIILAVIIVAVVVIAARCIWQHKRTKSTEQHYPSLSTLSTQRTSPSTSTSAYDESRMTAEMRLSAEEGVYEIPGQLYSVKEEEEEEEAAEDTAFRLSTGSRSVRFVRA